jgi:WAS family protein 1
LFSLIVKKMIQIPLIGQNIRPDEVSLRAIKTFEYLDNVVDQMFDRIDERIKKNMSRMDEISVRLQKVDKKIEALKTSKKAIKMYSPAQYPIENPPKFYPTFTQSCIKDKLEFNYQLNMPIESIENRQYTDKLQFFHLKTPKRTTAQKPDLLNNVTSINSLISFYNNENIYLSDAIAIKKEQSAQQSDNNKSELDEDMTDFSRFSTMIRNKQHGENFHYLPTLSQAPDNEFPLDLPDLEGMIAGDISFSVPDEELNVPSFRANMNIVNELPNITDLIEAKNTQTPVMEGAGKKDEIADVKMPEVSKLNEIPLPPPIPSNIPLPPPIPQNIPLPPPLLINNPTSSTMKKTENPVSSGDDARSSLLKAIRDAAGKPKLRSIPAAADEHPNPVPKKSQQQQSQQSQPMDLMSEMHQKLLMRRRGIAGSKEAKKEKTSMMSRLSSLIPPPPKKGPSSDDSDSSSDNDNNDDDDWN